MNEVQAYGTVRSKWLIVSKFVRKFCEYNILLILRHGYIITEVDSLNKCITRAV